MAVATAETETKNGSAQEEEDENCCPSWCPNWKIFTLQFSFTAGDMGTDVATCWNYYQQCNYLYAGLTLFFIVLQSLPTFVEFLKGKIVEIRAGELTVTPFNLKSKSLICGVVYLVFRSESSSRSRKCELVCH